MWIYTIFGILCIHTHAVFVYITWKNGIKRNFIVVYGHIVCASIEIERTLNGFSDDDDTLKQRRQLVL